MEEDTVELIDYLRIMWKRKILIIVGTIVCMVAGWVVNLRLTETYRAEVFVSIGKMVTSPPVSASQISISPIDTTGNLVKIIPIEYNINGEKVSKYHLAAEEVSGSSMVKISMDGPDRKVKELLKETVNRFIESHLRIIEGSIQPYTALLRNLEAEVKEIQKDLVESEATLLEMQTKRFEHEDLVKSEVTLQEIQIKEFEREDLIMVRNYTWKKSEDLKRAERDILIYQSIINRLKGEDCKTRLIGEMEITTIKPKRKRNILMAISAGFVVSIVLAFFIEYIGMARTMQKGKNA